MKYSIIVPIYNEKESLSQLHAEILQTMRALGESFEIIFIDDGSSDGSSEIFKKLSPLTVIQFRRNFGQTAALDAGIRHAQGEILITLDGDLQNPPSEIPKLLEQLGNGFDVVCGWRQKRKDSFIKKFISKGAKMLRRFFVDDGIRDSGCTLRVYRSECFDNVQLLGEMHRFIPAILRWQGFRIAEISVEHRSRQFGVTKYTWKRIVKGFVDMIAVWFWRKYANRPLHLFGGLGLFFAGLGILFGLVLAVLRILNYITLADSNMPLFAALLILVGIQLFISGILADILVRSYYKDGRKVYSVRQISHKPETTNIPTNTEAQHQ